MTIASLALAGCSGSSPKRPTTTKPSGGGNTTATTTVDTSDHRRFVLKPSLVVSTGPRAKFSTSSRQAANQFVERYLDVAMWRPQHSGVAVDRAAASEFSKLFEPAILAQLTTGSDRLRVVSDAPAPNPATDLDATITLHAIGDERGNIVRIAAEFSARTRGPSPTARQGELLLQARGTSWVISGFDLTVTRNRSALESGTTTTAKAQS